MIPERLLSGIHRIRIPFERIDTAVFLLTNGNEGIIFDSGTSPEDAETYIIPAVRALGIKIRFLAVSHPHEDHNGGYARLSLEYPDAESIFFPEHAHEGMLLLSRFEILRLPGHHKDCLGLLDRQTATLLTADALQQGGVDRYPTLISDHSAYLKTLERLAALPLQCVIASHAYTPMGAIARTPDEIRQLLTLCRETAKF